MVYNQTTVSIRRTDEFANWLKRLKDAQAKACINLRIRRVILTGNLGDYKPVGDGVYEFRVDIGPGYRVYFAWRGNNVVLLLIGGDKSSQSRDIKKAKQINRLYE